MIQITSPPLNNRLPAAYSYIIIIFSPYRFPQVLTQPPFSTSHSLFSIPR